MNWLERIRGGERAITTIEDYAAALNGWGSFGYGGIQYGLSGAGLNPVQQTMDGSPVEEIPHSFAGYAQAYEANGVIFACMLVRQQVFSAVRFQFQQWNHGRPGKLYGNSRLSILEKPWSSGTTQDLLTRMIQDVDLAGNAYLTTDIGDEVIRMRPDWTIIVLARRQSGIGYRRIGYAYQEGGWQSGEDPVLLLPQQVAHFAPTPDPLASYRGMSWLTPTIREIQSDNQMRHHKQKFFENAATPNLAVTLDPSVTPEMFERFKALMDNEHRGVWNAYKTLYLGGGADVEVIGQDFRKIDLKAIQGHGETRIAAAAGVPPVIVGLSEGLEAATYSNYSQARRRLADGTMHPLWGSASGTLERICPAEPGARLWYDSRDVAFLREDEKDAAEIEALRAQTIRTLTDGGYKPKSILASMDASDFSLLDHTNLLPVQLQPPVEKNPGQPQEETE